MSALDDGFVVEEGPCNLLVALALECARCRFDKTRYHDGLFDRYGVDCPAALAGAVVKRKAEFLAGRYAARRALQRMGRGAVAVGVGPHRSPIWPPGFVGSITHTEGTAVCAVALAERHAGVGIDLERWIARSVANDIRSTVAAPEEEVLLRHVALPAEQALTLVFSAKESLFKALYPRVGRYFDFRAARVVQIEPARGRLLLQLTAGLTERLVEGALFEAGFVLDSDTVFTWVLLQPPGREGNDASLQDDSHGKSDLST